MNNIHETSTSSDVKIYVLIIKYLNDLARQKIKGINDLQDIFSVFDVHAINTLFRVNEKLTYEPASSLYVYHIKQNICPVIQRKQNYNGKTYRGEKTIGPVK